MKKLGLVALVATLVLSSAVSLKAADKKGSPGGLELSGNVDVVTGWQHDSKNADTFVGTNGTNAIVSTINDADNTGLLGEGQLGDFRGLGSPRRDTFNFYLDQVELDLNKTFGENIRLRADLDFGRFLSGSQRVTGNNNFLLEQGYVTANIPLGNGVEFLIGRYNVPLGLESVDRAENITLSYTNLYRFIRPHNVTGAKIYYAFSDVFDLHIGVVNNLYDQIFGTPAGSAGNNFRNDTPVPSYHARFGFTWGEKGKEHVVGLSYAGGPEGVVPHLVGGTLVSQNLERHFTHIADIDYSFHVTDAFVIAGEAIYRQDNKNGGACNSLTKNCKSWAAQATFAYNFNETWNGYFRYEYLHDFQGNYTNVDQQIHAFSLGAGYQIADGAKMKLEYQLDLGLPARNIAKQTAYSTYGRTYWNNAFALEFAYNF